MAEAKRAGTFSLTLERFYLVAPEKVWRAWTDPHALSRCFGPRGRVTAPVATTRVAAAGGKIRVEDQEVPGMGRLCLFTDPEGRMMGLWQALRK